VNASPENTPAAPASIDLDQPELYLNRELAALEFNFRVLAQASDPDMPLLERLRFLCITNTNLDEFFEVRVAALRHHFAFGDSIPGPDRMPAGEVLERIRERSLALTSQQYAVWQNELLPALAREGIRFINRRQWNDKQHRWLKGYFQNEILPVLSPLGLDPAHPFPRILNKSLNLAVTLDGHDAFGREGHMALVRAPRSLPRIIRLPEEVSGSRHDFVFLSGLLNHFADDMFPGFRVKGSYQFRVTRNSELMVDEDEVENLASALSEELAGRGYAKPVRLEIASNCPKGITDLLTANFGLGEHDVYRCDGPVNINRVIAIHDMIDRPDLKFSKFVPRLAPALTQHLSIFDGLKQQDILLHQPYDAFQTVIELLRQAANDPQVLAIKQTLYRVGIESPLIDLLVQAARNGKDVTVVVELRARFDEAANIELATRLQEVGVQVVYGVVGHKTHAKMLLIVRREDDGLRRYAHLSTGNYHTGTSKQYTDLALITVQPEIGEDMHNIFQQLSGLGQVSRLKRLLQSPFTLHEGVIKRIEREIEHVRAGRSGRIIARMNALNEPSVVKALYRASMAGVEIDLIVRGGCTLRPDLPGISEHIRVRSVVGRFLEHSRVYWFANGGDAELFCSSADWMERNLKHRVEVAFPILDPHLAARVYDEALLNYLRDNTQAWRLEADGRYSRITPGERPPHSAQKALLGQLD
jgi:polyphosphate kinase